MPGAILAFLLMFLISPESTPVTLALVGDLMLGRGVSSAIESQDAAEIFAGLSPWLSSADIAFGNLESPVSADLPAAGGPYNLCAQPEGLKVLRAAGFDLLSTANNHSRDCLDSEDGQHAESSSSRWISSAGMNAVNDPHEAVEVNVRGLRLAFLAADDVSMPADMAALKGAVSKARDSGDFVVVSMHWGMEYQAGQSRRQTRLAGELADAGAGLIVGHHPHVTQPVECIYGKGREQPTVVFYSLGNALFDQHSLAGTRRGWLAYVKAFSNGAIDFSIIPFEIKTLDAGLYLIPSPAISGSCGLMKGR
jgi:poly-gamma-glutamate synthesis protein (capsule biosynthesis protein)